MTVPASVRLLLLAPEPGPRQAALRLLEAELPQAVLTVLADVEAVRTELAGSRYDAVVELVPTAAGPLLAGRLRRPGGQPAPPVLALAGAGTDHPTLWSLLHHPAQGARTGDEAHRRWDQALHQALRPGALEPAGEHEDGILDALEAATCAVDGHGRIVVRNAAWHAFARANGGGSGVAAEANYLEVCDRVQAADGAGHDARDARSVADGLRAVLRGELPRFEYDYPCHSPHEPRWFSVQVTPWMQRGRRRGAVLTHLEVTAAHQAHAALSHEVLHDDLTGLPNRLLLRDRLRQALHDATTSGGLVGVGQLGWEARPASVLTQGHAAVDRLLQQVAARLAQAMRPGDTLATLGGGELVVLWRLDDPEQVQPAATALLDQLAAPFRVGDAAVTVSASVGTVTSQDVPTVEGLLAAADTAMRRATSHGPHRVWNVGRDLDAAERERRDLQAELRTAIPDGQLVLHYQPVVELASGRVVGLEALVRWAHPTRGLLPPEMFVPAAERSGLIVPLGQWTLGRACQDAAALSGAARGLHVAVNLSTRQLTNHDVVGHVHSALADSGLDPSHLVLEVTESAIMQDEDVAARVLQELHQLGVRLAIDDFGTGYSPLVYLRRYPVSAIKIDRTFVATVPENAADDAICASIVGLADAVQATAVAEGIETAEQYAALRSMGCRLGQGFLWSPAVPLQELSAALAACQRVPRPVVHRRPPRPPAASAEDPAIRDRILGLQKAGASLHTIAAALNTEGSQTSRGMRWTAAAVARYLGS